MRRTVILVSCACIGIGLAACGSSGSSAKAQPKHVNAVATAYTTTLGAKTAKVTLSESVQSSSTAGSNESVNVNGTGFVDFANRSFELQVNAPSGGTEEILETGGIAYIQVPPAARSQVPGNKPWISIDLNKVAENKLGKSYAQVASLDSDSPDGLLANLDAVSDQIQTVGPSTVNGVPTTEYRATVDLNKEAARVGAKDGSKAASSITREEQVLGTHTLPVTVWVDGKGMVNQIKTQVPVPAASTGAPAGSGTATVTVTFSDFGTSVPVSPPPASQVADVTNQALQQSSGGSAA